jgi:hypothetical protein
MGSARTTDKILGYLNGHANVNITVTELMEATELTKSQVQIGMNNLRTRYGLNVQSIVSGNLWRYRPETEAEQLAKDKANGSSANTKTPLRGPGPSSMYELVGEAKTGIIIQDEDGKLYRAEEL